MPSVFEISYLFSNLRYTIPYDVIEGLLSYNETHQLPIRNNQSLLNFLNVEYIIKNNLTDVQNYMGLSSVEQAEIIKDYITYFNDEYILKTQLTDKGS